MEIIRPVVKPPMPTSCLRYPIAEQNKLSSEPDKLNPSTMISTLNSNSSNSSQSSPNQHFISSNLSSLPNALSAETKVSNQIEDKRPLSTEVKGKNNNIHPTLSNYQHLNEDQSQNQLLKHIFDGGNDEVLRKTSLPVDNLPDWGQLFQHFAYFYQNNIKNMNTDSSPTTTTTTSSTNPSTPPSALHNPVSNQISHTQSHPYPFHALLANMGQYFMNAQLGTNPRTQADSVQSSPNRMNMYDREITPNIQHHKDEYHANSKNDIAPTQLHINSNITFGDEHDRLAMTASFLAALAAQKDIPAPNITSNLPGSNPLPYPATITSVASTKPVLNPHVTEQSVAQSNISQNDFSTIYNSCLNLPDSRDFLYHLGERLIALASAKPETYPRPPAGWKPTTSINPTSFGYPQLNHTTSVSGNPLADIMKASNLFQLSTRSVPTNSNSTMTNSSIGSNMDKKSTNSNSTSPGFIGISMRGNQKYSAYYQHQRKQGTGLSAPEFGQTLHTSSSVNRRQYDVNSSPQGRCVTGGVGTSHSRRLRHSFPSSITSPFGSNARGHRNGRGHNNNMNPIFPNLRTSNYKQSGYNLGTQKLPENFQSAMINASGTDRLTPVNRIRDTAFLCSCGRDFESLYVFTLHMKDTGHKPKSDQTERDIPKLVRGQDMWINSETEQTREILRCMRCHQSFRNLPELTLHMMKTNHYSEIVYNDSGRLVFVNPDEQRRSTQNPNAIANTDLSIPVSSNKGGRLDFPISSPLITTQSSNRRGTRLPNTSSPKPDSDFNAKKSPPVITVENNVMDSNNAVDHTLMPKLKKVPSGSCVPQMTCTISTNIRSTKSEPPPSPPHIPPDSGHTPLSNSSLNLVCDDTSIRTKQSDLNVLSRIQSLIDNNLPNSNADNHSSSTSRISSPPSELSQRSIGTNMQRNYRKRRHSNTSLPPALDSEDDEQFQPPEKSYQSTNPALGNVSSSTEISNSLSENPLSSLQKLVDTTHKPIPPSAAFANSMDPSSLFITCPPNFPITPSKHLRGITDPTRDLYNVSSGKNSAASTTPVGSSNSTFTPLVSPNVEQEGIMPALSALYAYVEKSSQLQSPPPTSNQPSSANVAAEDADILCSNTLEAMDPFEPNQTQPNPHVASSILQAFCTATMSNRTMQMMAGSADQTIPMDVFKHLASISQNGGQLPPNTGENDWFKMLKSLTEQIKASISGNKISSDSQATTEAVSNYRIATPNKSSQRFEHPHTEPTNEHHISSPESSKACSLPTSHLSNKYQPNMPSRFPNLRILDSPTGPSQNSSNLMPTMITKKAKCHFCGKPFANKGQVRLHISKNKCPCLLQQSCHVAAMAAAFGSDIRPNQNPTVSFKQPNFSAILPTNQHSFIERSNNNSPSTSNAVFNPLENSNEAVTSALSLLKQRFQDFDPNNLLRSQNIHESNPNPLSAIFNKIPGNENPLMKQLNNQWNNSIPNSDAANPPTDAGAAANASHLAAMALLAQTLVQFTSAQNPRSILSDQTAEASPSTSTTNCPSYTLPSSGTNTIDPAPFPIFNPASMNFDLLLSQASIAKQLANWSSTTNTTASSTSKPAVTGS